MRRSTIHLTLVCLAAADIAGCTDIPKNAGFSDVQKEVANQIEQPVQWRGVTADDAAVDRSVRDFLSRPLTADTAVQVALLNNRSLQARYEDLGVAQADVVQAGLLKNPVFSFDARFPTSSPKKTYLDLSVEDDFIDVLLRPARQRVADATFAEIKGRVESAVLQLAADTRVAVYTCQAAAQNLDLQRRENQAEADSFDAAKRLYEAGNENDRSLLGEAAEFSRTRLQLAEAEQRIAEARERLANLMGLWGADAETWNISNPLPDPPEHEVDPAGLESLAIRQRPDLQAARDELLLQAHALGFAFQARYIQSLNLGANGERVTAASFHRPRDTR